MLVEAARRRAVEQTPMAHRRLERLFNHHRVKDGLEHSATAHNGLLDAIRLASGLVIRDPQHLRLTIALDQIDGATQPETALEYHIVSNARLIAHAGDTSERKLEAQRIPLLAIAREVVEPCDEIATDGGHFIDPDSLDGRGKLVVFATCNLVDRVVEHLTSGLNVRIRHRQPSSPLQRPEQARLDVVEDAAACERIHALKGLGLRQRLQTVKRRERELVWTGTELLQRRHRI